MSGAMWLNGSRDDGPVPFGLPVADMIAGHIATEGILAGLVQRAVTGRGTHVETSLLEAMVDLQFEVLTTYLNDGRRAPSRAAENGAHAYLAAPYGVYATTDGWLALAMTPLEQLAPLLDLPRDLALAAGDPAAFQRRDELKALIAAKLAAKPSAAWLDLLRPHDIWCAPVQHWHELLDAPSFRALEMISQGSSETGGPLALIRAPCRLNGQRPESARGAPRLGEHNAQIAQEFGLKF
jgi:crotonobetainyl-CoA:carnitine CoA-transferase CaiB-like acyl-CoA transferase